MPLISILFLNVLFDSSQKIISILAIGFATLLFLLFINLIKIKKLKSKIKELKK
jgi:hypothetical protein